jgi:hypothetical protein
MGPVPAAQSGPEPCRCARQERSEHRAAGTDQSNVAGAAVADVMAQQGAKGSTEQHHADDPEGKTLPVHAHILASPASFGHPGLSTLSA